MIILIVGNLLNGKFRSVERQNMKKGDDSILVKCKRCQKKDTEREMMVKVEKGTQKYYYHADCNKLQLEEDEFRKKESKELQSLLKTIKEIHDIQYIPPAFYPRLVDIRKGILYYGQDENLYDEIDYQTLEHTYHFCCRSIEKSKEKIQFDSTYHELKYGIAIVVNNIQDAKNSMKKDNLESVENKI